MRSSSPRSRRLSPTVVGAFLGAVVGAAVLWWPLLAPGLLLGHDALVPAHPLLSPALLGVGPQPPRAVPQDAVLALLGTVTDASLCVRVLLWAASICGGCCAGVLVARLLHGGPVTAAAVAVTSSLNPWVLQRVALGQWGLVVAALLVPTVGWATLSLVTAPHWRRVGLLGGVLAVASLTPTGGLLAGVVAVSVLLWQRASVRAWCRVAALWVCANGLWILAGWASAGDATAPTTVFRPDAPPGVPPLLAVLGGGGLWAVDLAPPSPLPLLSAGASAAVLLLGVGVAVRHRQGAVLLAGAVGMGLTLLALLPMLEGLWCAVQQLPGGGVLRDGQKFAALTVPLTLLGVGGITTACQRRGGAPLAVAGLLLVLALTTPTAPVAARSALTPRPLPTLSTQLATVIHSAPDRHPSERVLWWGISLVQDYPELPTPVVDPLTLLAGHPVIHSEGLLRHGQLIDATEGLRGDLPPVTAPASDWRQLHVRWLITPTGTRHDATHTLGQWQVSDLGPLPARPPLPWWALLGAAGYGAVGVGGLVAAGSVGVSWAKRRRRSTHPARVAAQE